MKNKSYLYHFLDAIFAFVIGILFLVLPEPMVKWIGIILGCYFIIKAILMFIIDTESPFQRTMAFIYFFLAILTFVFWGFLIKFVMFVFGVILALLGVMSLLQQGEESKKEKVWKIVTSLIEIVGGVAIAVISFTDALKVLGIVTGIILLFVSLLLFLHEMDKLKWNQEHDHPKKNKDVLDAEIISENVEDVEK